MSNSRQGRIKAKVKCSCKGNNLDKFLQPNILILLAKEDLHGYSIIQELEKKDLFGGEKADNAGVYRTLRILEDRGMVHSEWEVAGEGAAKKTYKITEAGLQCLNNWILTLEQHKRTIEIIINNAKAVLK